MSETLKPCPFCGNADPEVEREGNHRQSCIVICGMCGCRLESNEDGAGHDWNRRTPGPETALVMAAFQRVLNLSKTGVFDLCESTLTRHDLQAFIAEWEPPA